MKAPSAWIVTGALGAVGLGAGVAAAQGTFDRTPTDAVVADAVQVGDDGASATLTSHTAASPSPAAVQNGTSITTVTAGSVATPTTAPTTQTANTAPSAQTAQTAQTAPTAQTAASPVSPVTPQSAQTAPTAASTD